MELIQIDRKTLQRAKREKLESQVQVGKFSEPSKMPCFSWSISAHQCKTGGKLAKIKGSVCYRCYALRGFYNMPSTVNAMARRLSTWKKRKKFVESFVNGLAGEKYFRWFDSGDLQSLAMLEDINAIAKQTPDCLHWLPSKEVETVKAFLVKHGSFAPNLIVRLSAYFVDQEKHSMLTGNGSIVLSHGAKVPENVSLCNAPEQGGKCLDCRACWQKENVTVAYIQH